MVTIETLAFDQSWGGMRSATILDARWVVSLLLLVSGLTTPALGGVPGFLGRTQRIRDGRPLAIGVRWGLLLALQVVACVFAASGSTPDNGPLLGGIAIAKMVVLTAALFFLKRRHTWRQFARSVGVACATIAAVSAFCAAAVCLSIGLTTAAGYVCVLRTRTAPDEFAEFPTRMVFGAVAPAIPMIATVAFAVRSRIRSIPISVGVVHGLRTCAIPIVAALASAYIVALCGTLVQDSYARSELDQQLENEGKYAAAQIGAEWPGPVALPTAAQKVDYGRQGSAVCR